MIPRVFNPAYLCQKTSIKMVIMFCITTSTHFTTVKVTNEVWFNLMFMFYMYGLVSRAFCRVEDSRFHL